MLQARVKSVVKRLGIRLLSRRLRSRVIELKTMRIFRYGGIGDLIALTAALQALHRWNPNLRVTLVTCPGMADIFANTNPPLTIVEMEASANLGFLRAWYWRRELNRCVPDIDLFLHNDVRSILFARSLKSNYMFGFDSDEQGYGQIFDKSLSTYSRKYEKSNPSLHIFHVSHLFHRAVEITLGISLKRQPIHLCSSSTEQLLLQQKLALSKISVGLLPCGTDGVKIWPTINYVQLAQKLIQELNVNVLVIGGPLEREKEPDFIGLQQVKFLAGKLSIRESFAALASCAVVVGNDTGMMHAAVALGCKTVALFGPTSSTVYGYHGPNNAILMSDRECIPCNSTVCELRRGEEGWQRQSGLCLEDLRVSQVYSSIIALLGITSTNDQK